MGRTVVVTGMSGAGRTTCLKILEDLGYEAVDNLPMGLVGRLLRIEEGEPYDVAVGIDSRTRDFDPQRLVSQLKTFRADAPGPLKLLFIDCEDDVLRRRFSATRRRHPLADQLPVEEALARERTLLEPLRRAADLVLDTTDLALPELRQILTGHFAGGEPRLQIAVLSFSYKRGLPRDADLVFDVRFLRNPHYVDELRPLTGRDEPVRAHIAADPGFGTFVDGLKGLLRALLPRYAEEGKSYLTLAFGCTGGQHRSVHLAELLAEWLRQEGWEVAVRHRDLPAALREAS